MLLISARVSVAIHKIGDGRAAHHDGFFQYVLQRAMKSTACLLLIARAQLCGVNFGAP